MVLFLLPLLIFAAAWARAPTRAELADAEAALKAIHVDRATARTLPALWFSFDQCPHLECVRSAGYVDTEGLLLCHHSHSKQNEAQLAFDELGGLRLFAFAGDHEQLARLVACLQAEFDGALLPEEDASVKDNIIVQEAA